VSGPPRPDGSAVAPEPGSEFELVVELELELELVVELELEIEIEIEIVLETEIEVVIVIVFVIVGRGREAGGFIAASNVKLAAGRGTAGLPTSSTSRAERSWTNTTPSSPAGTEPGSTRSLTVTPPPTGAISS
jgi:hypothetical protein